MTNHKDTKPLQALTHFDIVIVDIPPAKRMKVMDMLLKNNLLKGVTMIDALIMTFQLPSVIMHCVSLEEAEAMELIMEVAGATVRIRTARHCEEDEAETPSPDDEASAIKAITPSTVSKVQETVAKPPAEEGEDKKKEGFPQPASKAEKKPDTAVKASDTADDDKQKDIPTIISKEPKPEEKEKKTTNSQPTAEAQSPQIREKPTKPSPSKPD